MTASIPATPEEKLRTRLAHAKADAERGFGKGFDEELERRVLGLPPVEGRDPIVIPASRSRIAMWKDIDANAEREIAEAAEKSNANEMRLELSTKDAEIAQLRRQLAEANGLDPDRLPPPAPPDPKLVADASKPPEATEGGLAIPDTGWTRKQMIEWAKERQVPITLPGGGQFSTTSEVLENVLMNLKQQE